MGSSDNRHNEIFRCIVESYIDNAEPVGSRTVSKAYGGLSPASIRNVMSDLEEAGLIHQPHTSAGRVPTDKGYRTYVDSLLTLEEDESIQVPDITRLFREAHDIEDGVERVSRLLADLTSNAAVLYVRRVKRISYLDAMREEIRGLLDEIAGNYRLYVDGTSHVTEQPEFRDADRVTALLRVLEAKQALADVLEKDLEPGGIHVHIGREVHWGGLSGVSMIVKEYSAGDRPIGCLAVIGPTRMKYEQTIGVVRRLADSVTEFLNRG